MNKKLNKVIENLNNKNHKVIRVTRTEFELDNSDIYPHGFDIDENISVEEFQQLLDESKDTILNHLEKISKEKSE